VEGQSAYTVDEAAAILGESPERVRDMLATGELEGIPPGATLAGEWKVLLPATPGERETPPDEESRETPSEDQDEGPPSHEATVEFVQPPQSATEDEQVTAATEDLSRGDDAVIARESADPEGEVTTQQAARALGISPRTVRWHIEQGNLVARPEGEGVNRTWLVSISSLHAFRDKRQAAGEMPRGYHAPAQGSEIAAESSGEAIRVLAGRLEDAAARAAEYRVRLELSERAQSTLEADLTEERRRREAAERERDELRRRLEARPEPRESPVSPAHAESPTGRTGADPQGAREATQRAAEALRGPEPYPTTGGAEVGLQRPAQPRGRRSIWRRVFGG
jgi:hypothetical protein